MLHTQPSRVRVWLLEKIKSRRKKYWVSLPQLRLKGAYNLPDEHLFCLFEPVKIRRKRLKILRLFPTPAEWTNRGRDEDNKAPEEF